MDHEECLLSGSDDESADDVTTRFQIDCMFGDGAHGQVFKAVELETGETVAIKKCATRLDEGGLRCSTLREISLLKQCVHPNIVRLQDVVANMSAIYLVMEYLDCDLRQYLKKHGPIVRRFLLQRATMQCCMGLEFMHCHRMLHRDLKPQNLLLDLQEPDFNIKIADFGLARCYTFPLKQYTGQVVTLWYRAPELLLGAKLYGTWTDIWSLGCILADMATGKALFPGDSEIGTIFMIFRLLGTPTEEVWPGVSQLADMKPSFPKWKCKNLWQVWQGAPGLGDEGIDLLRRLLAYDPVRRPSASALVRSDAFLEGSECIKP